MTLAREDPIVPDRLIKVRRASALIRSSIVVLGSGVVLVEITDFMRVVEYVANPAATERRSNQDSRQQRQVRSRVW